MRAVKPALLAVLLLAAAIGPAQAAPTQAAHSPVTPSPVTPSAAAPGPIVTYRGEAPEAGGRSAEMVFVSGARPHITAQVADDIFASGGELRVDGASADHLFLAGGEIDAAPAAVHDLIAAGGHILLRAGAVGDDVVAAGGEIGLDRAARIAGSAVLAGGRLRIEAPVGGALMAAGGRVELNGPVAGDARLRGREIVIGPQARIGGDLLVSGQRIEISPGAVVQGRTVRQLVRRDGHMAAGLGVLCLIFALGVLLMLGVVAAAAPRLMDGVDRRLRARLGVTMGTGALVLFLAPALILALLATVLGAPLALVLGLAYLLALPLAFACVAYWGGQLLRARLRRAREAPQAAMPPLWSARFGWTVLAGLLLMIACSIPILGGVVWLLTLVTGMGALASQVVPHRPGPAPAPP